MAAWSLPGGGLAFQEPSIASGKWSGVSVVASSTAHTKGAWVEVTASTLGPVVGVHILLNGNSFSSTVNTSTLLDVGIGEAGSEIVIVPDLQIGYRSSSYGARWFIPVSAPAVVRLALRSQSAVTSKSIGIIAIPVYGVTGSPGSTAGGRVTTYGADAATSRGVTVASGSAAYGSWVEIVASTTAPINGLVVGHAAAGSGSLVNGNHMLAVGLGTAGAEQTLWATPFYTESTELIYMNGPNAGSLELSHTIPEGSRLVAAIHSASGLNGNFDVIIHGITY